MKSLTITIEIPIELFIFFLLIALTIGIMITLYAKQPKDEVDQQTGKKITRSRLKALRRDER